MKKYILVGIVAVAIVSLATVSYSISGVFSKAFDKTLYPGESYEKNITVRKYYNITVRFQKENSTSSYLSFDGNETNVVLKGASDNVVFSGTGVSDGKIYFFMDKATLDKIKTVSAYSLGEYLDVVDQSVNATYSGTTAFITVKVRYKPSAIFGYVVDEMTSQTVDGVEVLAVANSANPATSEPISQNVSDSSGRYFMSFQLDSSKALDIYVKDYDAS